MTFEEWHKDTHKDKLMNLCCIGYALEAWNASAEAHKPRWIPVSEMLPTITNAYYPVITKNTIHKNTWTNRYFLDDKFQFYDDVIYWLELPEIPE